MSGLRTALGHLATAMVALLLFTTTASASEPHVEHGEDLAYVIHADGVGWHVTWNITDDVIHIAAPGHTDPSRHDDAPLEVFIGIGTEGDAAPSEWYVLHHGNTSYAVAHTGAVQVDPRDGLGTPYWTIDRIDGVAGDCIVVAAQTWQRVDSQKQVLERVPGIPLVDAWGNGHNCHDQAEAPAVATEPADKKIPLGFLLPTIALIAVAVLRRP